MATTGGSTAAGNPSTSRVTEVTDHAVGRVVEVDGAEAYCSSFFVNHKETPSDPNLENIHFRSRRESIKKPSWYVRVDGNTKNSRATVPGILNCK